MDKRTIQLSALAALALVSAVPAAARTAAPAATPAAAEKPAVPATESEKTVTEDNSMWSPDAEHYTKFTLNLNGHNLILLKPLNADLLIINGSGSLMLLETTLNVPRVRVMTGTVSLPSASVRTIRHLEIAPNATAVASLTDANYDLNEFRISGPLDADGNVTPGGTFRKEGTGRLQLRGCKKYDYDLDSVTLEITDGTLWTGKGNRDFGIHDTKLRFVKNAAAWTSGDKENLNGAGNYNEVYVDTGKHIDIGTRAKLCFSYTKTGAGSVFHYSLHKSSAAAIAEGTWHMTDDAYQGRVTVKSGAVAIRSAGTYRSPVTLEPGAKLGFGKLGPVLMNTTPLDRGYITSSQPIEFDGLPEKPTEELKLLETDQRGLTFSLPKAYEGYSVYYDAAAQCYKTYLCVNETVTPEADGEWLPTAGRYENLTFCLNGKNLTVSGELNVKNIIVTGSGSLTLAEGAPASVGCLRAETSVRISPTLLAAIQHLEIARDAVVTMHEDLDAPPAPDTDYPLTHWFGWISGPADDTGKIQPGGKFRKEGSKGFALYGRKSHYYTLSSVTLEIAGGRLETRADNELFIAYNSEIRFVESADRRWGYTGYHDMIFEGSVNVFVAEGLSVSCGSWLRGSVNKSGPGDIRLCMKDGFSAVVDEGTWTMLGGSGNAQPGAVLTVGPKGAVRHAPGTEAFLPELILRPGAKIIYSAESPVKMGNRITADGPIEMAGLPDRNAFRRDPVTLLETSQKDLTFDLGPNLQGIGVIHDGSRYVAKMMMDEDTAALENDTTWTSAPPVRNLDINLNGHVLTIASETIFETLTVHGSGTVRLLPGKPAAEGRPAVPGGSLRAERLIVADPNARVTVDAETVGTVDCSGSLPYPTRPTPEIEIAQGAVLTVEGAMGEAENGTLTPLPLYYRGCISGPRTVAENGTVSFAPGGTLRKTGAGRLVLTEEEGLCGVDNATLELADGAGLDTLSDSPFYFRDAVIAFTGTNDGLQKWNHTPGRTLGITGTLTVHTDAGRSIWLDAWVWHGKLIKTGPGLLSSCHESSLTTEVCDGTLLIDGGDSKNGTVAIVKKGAVALWDNGSGAFRGRLIMEAGAKLKSIDGAVPEVSGTIEAAGPIELVGLPADPVEDTAVLVTAQTEVPLKITDPAYADFSVLYSYERKAYVIRHRSEAVKELTGSETWRPESAHYTKLTLNTAGHTLTVAGRTLDTDELILTGGGSVILGPDTAANVSRIVAESSVRISWELLKPVKHLEIAKDQTVTFAADENADWYGRATGPITADGVQPGGTLRKEGTGLLKIFGLAGRLYDLDSVTLDIAGGRLRTEKKDRDFTVRSTAVRFIENANRPEGQRGWEHSGWVRSADPLRVHVGEGVPLIFCDAWMHTDIIKSGPGAFEFALDTDFSAVIESGLWQMCGGSVSEHGKMITVKNSAVAAHKPGAWSFRTPITFEKGAGIGYSAKGPIELNSRAAVTAEAPIKVVGLPETPAGDLILLVSPQENIPLELPENYISAGYTVLYDAKTDAYTTTIKPTALRKLEITESGEIPDSFTAERVEIVLANDCTATLTGNIRALKELVVSGRGTVALADGKTLIANTLVQIAADSTVTLPASALFSATDRRTADIEIGPGAVLTAELTQEMYAEGDIRGPRVDGTVQPGGTFRKKGKGKLRLYRMNNPAAAMEGITFEVLEGSIGTFRSSRANYMFRNTAIRFPVKNAGTVGWDYTGSTPVYFSGNCEIYAAEGTYAKAYFFTETDSADAVLTKTGPGSFVFCPYSKNTPYRAIIEEGTYRVNRDHLGTTEVTLGKKGALGSDGGRFSGKLTFLAGAAADLTYGIPGITGTCTAAAEGVIPVRGISVPPAECEGKEVFFAPKDVGLTFALPAEYAGWAVAWADGAYRIVKDTTPGADIVITPPEGQTVTPGSALEQALKTAAHNAGAARVTLTEGIGNGHPLTVDGMNSAVAVFGNALTLTPETDGSLTAAVGYTFAVTDIRIGTGSAVFTVSALSADGKPLTLTPGAAIRLLENGHPLEGTQLLSADGTAVFTLPLKNTMPNLRAEAYREETK